MGIVPSGSLEDRLVVRLFSLALASPLVLLPITRSVYSLGSYQPDPHVLVDAYFYIRTRHACQVLKVHYRLFRFPPF